MSWKNFNLSSPLLFSTLLSLFSHHSFDPHILRLFSHIPNPHWNLHLLLSPTIFLSLSLSSSSSINFTGVTYHLFIFEDPRTVSWQHPASNRAHLWCGVRQVLRGSYKEGMKSKKWKKRRKNEPICIHTNIIASKWTYAIKFLKFLEKQRNQHDLQCIELLQVLLSLTWIKNGNSWGKYWPISVKHPVERAPSASIPLSRTHTPYNFK